MVEFEKERRRHSRSPYSGKIQFRVSDVGRGESTDISDGGIGFFSDRNLDSGDSIDVIFLENSVAVKGVIRRIADGPPEKHMVGVEFQNAEKEVVGVVLATDKGFDDQSLHPPGIIRGRGP